MAQADEMGEGEVKDDGFVDCPPGPEGNRRRNKKRPGELAGVFGGHVCRTMMRQHVTIIL